VGCFRYENVSSADSNALACHVSEEVKQERWERFMEAQQVISAKRLKRHVGRTLPVLIDEVSETAAIGRSPADAPEIDGVVHVKLKGRVLAGSIIQVKIESSDAYDLHGAAV